MSKLYTKYLELKRKDANKLYLIKSGLFYIFIDEDAKKMSQALNLKCVFLTGEIVKCGFPENAKNKYLRKLQELNQSIEIIESEKKEKNYFISDIKLESLAFLKTLDLNRITPIEALEYLNTLQKELRKLI